MSSCSRGTSSRGRVGARRDLGVAITEQHPLVVDRRRFVACAMSAGGVTLVSTNHLHRMGASWRPALPGRGRVRAGLAGAWRGPALVVTVRPDRAAGRDGVARQGKPEVSALRGPRSCSSTTDAVSGADIQPYDRPNPDPYLPHDGVRPALGGGRPKRASDRRLWSRLRSLSSSRWPCGGEGQDVTRWTVFVTATPSSRSSGGRRDGRADHRTCLPRLRAAVAAPAAGAAGLAFGGAAS